MHRPFGNYIKATAISVLWLWITVVSADLYPDNSSLPTPNTSLQPGEIVRIVIDALANNNNPYPDAGIEITFNFASPANKVNTGPIERFTSMVKGPVFGVMLNHQHSEFSEVVLAGNRAYQMVRLLTRDGVAAHFAFRLGLQGKGGYRGMWMTEAVWPVGAEKLEGTGV
jgi:hypothetical protein